MRRHRRAPARSGIADYDDATRFQQLLDAYFKLPAARRSAAPQPKSAADAACDEGRDGATASSAAPARAEETQRDALKTIKLYLRHAQPANQTQFTRRVLDVVMHQLKRAKWSALVLPRAVALCSELFARSVAFRALVAANASALYASLLVAAGEQPSAPAHLVRASRAQQSANAALQQVLAMVESWKDAFGAKYPPIAAGYAALEQQGYTFPHARETQHCAQQQAQAARTLRRRIRRVQLDQMHRALPEMEDVIVEMNRIFAILVPTLDAFHLADDGDDGDGARPHATASQDGATDAWEDAGNDDDDSDDAIEWETVPSSVAQADAFDDEQREDDEAFDDPLTRMDMNEIVQAYGLGSASYQLTIAIPVAGAGGVQSHDNAVLFQHLADGIRRIRKRFLPLVHEWRAHALEYRNSSSADENSNNGDQDEEEEDTRESDVMPRISDLQQRLDEIVAKWGELVEDCERHQLAQIPSSIVSMPLAAYTPRQQQQPRPVKRARNAPPL